MAFFDIDERKFIVKTLQKLGKEAYDLKTDDDEELEDKLLNIKEICEHLKLEKEGLLIGCTPLDQMTEKVISMLDKVGHAKDQNPVMAKHLMEYLGCKKTLATPVRLRSIALDIYKYNKTFIILNWLVSFGQISLIISSTFQAITFFKDRASR